VSIIGYIAQLVELPESFAVQERHCISGILHLATNAATHSVLLGLDVAGGPRITSLLATAKAALARTAVQTLP
jgi:hypothetical protein